MIKIVTSKDDIISLWHDVFGDDEKYIVYFLDNCKNKICLGYYMKQCLVSMIFLIECNYCGCKGQYLYAVATDKNFRNRGYASRLIEQAKKQMYDFLWLIPANEKLFDYYAKQGFKIKLYSDSDFKNKISFTEKKDIIADLYDGSEFENPKGMFYSLKEFPDGDTGMKNKGE